MAKLKKKGKSGQAKNFITRTQAVRKLQISLPDFRRLCIFKGIYPREPRNKKKASKTSTPATTFYYAKDIQYLLHEPLLSKFRDHKILAKKISRALGRGEVGDAARLEKTHKPRITLDHVIKERYPTFVDALRDLDDALSMLFLFANLPSNSTIPPKTIAVCQRLCHEFEHYLIVTNSLRKSFLSIKGIYYQATIQGQDILWLVPYKFVQRVTGNVDFRIMSTFVEFYTTLLGFVNYRLYTSVGLIYPPKFNPTSDEKGGELGAYTLQGQEVGDQLQIESAELSNENSVQVSQATERAQAAANNVTTDPQDSHRDTSANDENEQDQTLNGEQDLSSTAVDTFTPIAADADTLVTPQSTSDEAARLFAPYTFYLSRETPRHALEFLLRAFGCRRVGWPAVRGEGAYTTDESDPSITHQIVDRPPQPPLSSESSSPAPEPPSRFAGRAYVQPQWVWDSVNAGALQRPDLYAPGATLPPHLSPWIRPTRGAYDPLAPLAPDAQDEAEAEAAQLEEEDQLDGSASAEEEDSGPASPADANGAAFDGLSSASDEEEEEGEEEAAANDTLHADSLAQETHRPPSTSRAKPAPPPQQRRRERQQKQEQEELERRKMMMPRRKRKLYERMAHGNAARDEERARLEGKRRKIERERAGKR